MQLVLASGNSGKIREFKQLLGGEIKAFSEIIEAFEIVEDGNTFAENARIKARAIYERLGSEYLVISDDSGISVPLLGGIPGIYSARYAGEDATAKQNLDKLISEVGKQVDRTPAYYTAAIAIVSRYGEYVVHGWMHGDVIAESKGNNGFGYDPMFIPEGYGQTLAELDETVKAGISHRHKALALAVPIIEMLRNR
jgi:XTP/dITP diphosphohydrolase